MRQWQWRTIGLLLALGLLNLALLADRLLFTLAYRGWAYFLNLDHANHTTPTDIVLDRNHSNDRIYTSNPPRIEIFAVAWEERFLLPYFVRFYSERLGMAGLRITIYDNESQDGTAELAESLGCRVTSYSTDGQLSDAAYVQIKNDCWRESEADWILIADLDEWIDLRPEHLDAFDAYNVTVIKNRPITLVWENDTSDLASATPCGITGNTLKTSMYGKINLFNRHAIENYRIRPGGHQVQVQGDVKRLKDVKTSRISMGGLESLPPRPRRPVLFHVKYFDETYILKRYMRYQQRLSEENVREKWGIQYFEENLPGIHSEFETARRECKPIKHLREYPLFGPRIDTTNIPSGQGQGA